MIRPSIIYPVPQSALHVSAEMNVLNFPEGKRPNPEPLFYPGSDSLPLCGLWFGTKATDVSPWDGVYDGKQDPSSGPDNLPDRPGLRLAKGLVLPYGGVALFGSGPIS